MKKISILLAIAILISSFPYNISLYGSEKKPSMFSRLKSKFSKKKDEEPSYEESEGASETQELDGLIVIFPSITAKLDATSKSATTAESTLDKLSNVLNENIDHEIIQLMASKFYEIGHQYGKISAAIKDILNGVKAIVQFSKLKKEPTNFDLKKKTTGINTIKIGLQKFKSMEAKLYKNRANSCILLQSIINKSKNHPEEEQVTTEIRSTTLTSVTRSFMIAMGDEVKGIFRKKNVDGIEKQLTSLIEKLNTIINDGTIDEEVLPLMSNFLYYLNFFVTMHAENLECFSGIMHFLDNNSVTQMEEVLERMTALLADEHPPQDEAIQNAEQENY